MNALDTNVVVRLLVADDLKQAKSARRLLEKAGSDYTARFLIPWLVLLETIWVLRTSYGFSREDILRAIEALAGIGSIAFESPDLLSEFLVEAASSSSDLSDHLIGLYARSAGCASTLTFDKKAGKLSCFDMVRA